jgi:hypothetical protein
MVSCSGIKSQVKNDNVISQFKIIKIDSTKNMYLIQIQNNHVKELLVAEKDCKIKFDAKNKIKTGASYSFKIDPIDAYFNDDDFQRFGFKVDNIDVKSLTEGAVYTSNNLCGLYLIE